MFKILLSNQYQNAKTCVNPPTGLLTTNFVPLEWSSSNRGGHVSYDGNAAQNNIESHLSRSIIVNAPTVIDTEHINHKSYPGRQNIAELLEIYHNATGYYSQIGFCRTWPTATKTALLVGQIKEAIHAPFKQDRYGKPDILKLVQFIVCWLHPYTQNWDEWEKTLNISINEASIYHKPVYADITLSYHQMSKSMRDKPIEIDRLRTILNQIHVAGFDGVIIRDIDDTLNQEYHEVILNTLNQINERVSEHVAYV